MIPQVKKRASWMTALLAAAAVLTCLLPVTLIAQNNNEDPPGRVARIRYIQGSVSFEPAGESEWVAAVTNRPVTIGDQLWTDAGSRAELDIGSAVIRINANTGFSFLNLDDRTAQIQLTQGTIDLRVRRLGQDEIVEVDTPNQAFSVTQPGEYRVEAGADGNSSMVTVRQGHGQVTGGGRSYDLSSGQSGTFTGTDVLDGQLVDVSAPDDFDRWSELRDRQYENSQSARYVSRDVVGYEDLDANGTWSNDPSYGNVWTPTSVPTGWAPYRNGHWVWVSPWGWTWVDDAPWGYAPFHYGRWVSHHGRWGWVPGPINVRPVYAPALVAFIGGSSFGISISAGQGGYGGGDVGWFPLGPREVYVPAYQASPRYVERVNTTNTVVNTTTITNVYNNQVNNNQVTNVTYVNRAVPGAVTAVPQSALRSSAPVAKVAVPVDVNRVASAPVSPRAAVVPERASVLGTAAPAQMAHPPAAVINRPVVAKTPPPPPVVPFAKQQQEMAKHPGQPLPVQQLRPANVAAAHPAVKLAPPAKPATLNASQPNAGNAKQPANATAQQQAAQQQAAQQQAEKTRQQQAQQQAAQQQAEKARQEQAQQQAAQQQAEKARQQQAQQQAAQQQAEKARQQQAQQQQAAQQQAEKARQQQAQQQQAAQQQAEKARQQQAQQQQAAQQQAEKAHQQQAQQQQAAQQQAEKARQQQAQQQAAQQQEEKVREQQAQAAQQQAERAREQQLAQQRAQQQEAQQHPNRPPSAQPAPPPKAQPQPKPAQPQTPAEKAKEEQKKHEQQQPPQ